MNHQKIEEIVNNIQNRIIRFNEAKAQLYSQTYEQYVEFIISKINSGEFDSPSKGRNEDLASMDEVRNLLYLAAKASLLALQGTNQGSSYGRNSYVKAEASDDRYYMMSAGNPVHDEDLTKEEILDKLEVSVNLEDPNDVYPDHLEVDYKFRKGTNINFGFRPGLQFFHFYISEEDTDGYPNLDTFYNTTTKTPVNEMTTEEHFIMTEVISGILNNTIFK